MTRPKGKGEIIIVCQCGFLISHYIYESGHDNKYKFVGPRTKSFIDVLNYECPMCGNKLDIKYMKIFIYNRNDFYDKYIVGKFRIYNRNIIEHDVKEDTIEDTV